MKMRAKIQINSVTVTKDENDKTTHEVVKANPVSNKPFNPDGESEDNSFARWTPSGSVELTITNPDLFGKFVAGQKFYVDFTPAE